ncbi:hypothetical protein [Rhizobium sp. Kim5]|uniref:hypothetical protein n=1 Tax=Rhizobium sp. Kim5 TaxID=2020311 RepID=UPI000A3311F5|nr:hypothetical protein [Rhizobium sp. Kim5]
MANANTPRLVTFKKKDMKAANAVMHEFYLNARTAAMTAVPLTDPVVVVTPTAAAAGERKDVAYLLDEAHGPYMCLSFVDIAEVETVTVRDLFLVFFNELKAAKQTVALGLLIMFLADGKKHGVDEAILSSVQSQATAIMTEAAYYFKYR